MTADDRSRKRLSTGHVVELPLELEFATGGVVVPARRSRLEAILPEELSSLAIAPGVGCAALVGIQYHRVGGGNRDATGLEPYDEFAVIVPAIYGGRTNVPLAQLAGGTIGGYVHWLPVTTEPSVALGREIWGYPKERTDLTVTDGPDGIRTVVRGDGGEIVRLEIPRPRPRTSVDVTTTSFTTADGTILQSAARLRGEIALGPGLWPETRFEVGSDLTRELGLWRRPLVRFYGSDLRARLSGPERRDGRH